MNDAQAIVERLTDAQKREILLVRDEDYGCLARGDQAGLVGAGLAMAPKTCNGFYQLNATGLSVRKLLEKQNG